CNSAFTNGASWSNASLSPSLHACSSFVISCVVDIIRVLYLEARPPSYQSMRFILSSRNHYFTLSPISITVRKSTSRAALDRMRAALNEFTFHTHCQTLSASHNRGRMMGPCMHVNHQNLVNNRNLFLFTRVNNPLI